MNVIGPGAMTSVDVADITAKVASLLNDTDTGETAVVFTRTGSSFDPATGIHADSGDQDSVTAYLSPLTLREVAESNGLYQVGDVQLHILASDLTVAPSTQTRFSVGNDRYSVIQADRDSLGLTWEIVGRRIK